MMTSTNEWRAVQGTPDESQAVQASTKPQATDAASLWRQTTVLACERKGHEAFAIGPDGLVWSYRLATAQTNAGRLVSTHLPAQQFACVRLTDSRILLTSISGQKLHMTCETGEPEPRWQPVRTLRCPELESATSLEQVHLLQLGFEVLVGVLACHRTLLGTASRRFWVGRWTGETFSFRNKPVSLQGDDSVGNAFLFGPSKATASSGDGGLRAYEDTRVEYKSSAK